MTQKASMRRFTPHEWRPWLQESLYAQSQAASVTKGAEGRVPAKSRLEVVVGYSKFMLLLCEPEECQKRSKTRVMAALVALLKARLMVCPEKRM